jgi:hypothetical protein
MGVLLEILPWLKDNRFADSVLQDYRRKATSDFIKFPCRYLYHLLLYFAVAFCP